MVVDTPPSVSPASVFSPGACSSSSIMSGSSTDPHDDNGPPGSGSQNWDDTMRLYRRLRGMSYFRPKLEQLETNSDLRLFHTYIKHIQSSNQPSPPPLQPRPFLESSPKPVSTATTSTSSDSNNTSRHPDASVSSIQMKDCIAECMAQCQCRTGSDKDETGEGEGVLSPSVAIALASSPTRAITERRTTTSNTAMTPITPRLSYAERLKRLREETLALAATSSPSHPSSASNRHMAAAPPSVTTIFNRDQRPSLTAQSSVGPAEHLKLALSKLEQSAREEIVVFELSDRSRALNIERISRSRISVCELELCNRTRCESEQKKEWDTLTQKCRDMLAVRQKEELFLHHSEMLWSQVYHARQHLGRLEYKHRWTLLQAYEAQRFALYLQGCEQARREAMTFTEMRERNIAIEALERHLNDLRKSTGHFTQQTNELVSEMLSHRQQIATLESEARVRLLAACLLAGDLTSMAQTEHMKREALTQDQIQKWQQLVTMAEAERNRIAIRIEPGFREQRERELQAELQHRIQIEQLEWMARMRLVQVNMAAVLPQLQVMRECTLRTDWLFNEEHSEFQLLVRLFASERHDLAMKELFESEMIAREAIYRKERQIYGFMLESVVMRLRNSILSFDLITEEQLRREEWVVQEAQERFQLAEEWGDVLQRAISLADKYSMTVKGSTADAGLGVVLSKETVASCATSVGGGTTVAGTFGSILPTLLVVNESCVVHPAASTPKLLDVTFSSPLKSPTATNATPLQSPEGSRPSLSVTSPTIPDNNQSLVVHPPSQIAATSTVANLTPTMEDGAAGRLSLPWTRVVSAFGEVDDADTTAPPKYTRLHHKASSKIQRWWRCRTGLRKLAQYLRSDSVQAEVLTWLCRGSSKEFTEFKRIYDALVRLQAVIRSWKVRRKFGFLLSSVVLMRSHRRISETQQQQQQQTLRAASVAAVHGSSLNAASVPSDNASSVAGLSPSTCATWGSGATGEIVYTLEEEHAALKIQHSFRKHLGKPN